MTARYQADVLLEREEIVAAPERRACEDQSFEMPTGVYFAMGVLFLGFVSVLSFAFMGPTMVVPYAVIVAFLAAFFAVPATFIRTSRGRSRSKALGWYEYRERGIATACGRTPAGEATILALLLPFLIFIWAIAVAIIAAII